MQNEIPQEVLDTEVIAPDTDSTLRRRMQGYRTDAFVPEYDKDGKLKPLQRWIGVTLAAKRMVKRLMRQSHAQEKTAMVEKEPGRAHEAYQQKHERSDRIKTLNTEIWERRRAIKLGTTPEQIEARAMTDKTREEEKKEPYKDISEYTPEEGGPFDPYLPKHQDPGYIGVELRVIRREHGVGRPV